MKKYSAYIILFGGLITFYSFALPWHDNFSGAQLANSGGATIITGILILTCVIFGSCFSILNRERSWNTVSKLLVWINSCVVLFLAFLFLDSLGMNFSILVFPLLLFGIIVYITNRAVFLTYWKTVLVLIFGSGSILFCMYLVPFIVEYSINFIAINFIGTLTIIGISIYRLFRPPPYNLFSNFLLILCCGIGLSTFLIIFLGKSLSLIIVGDSLYTPQNTPQNGIFLMAIGYITAIIGTLSNIKHIRAQKIQEEHNEIMDS